MTERMKASAATLGLALVLSAVLRPARQALGRATADVPPRESRGQTDPGQAAAGPGRATAAAKAAPEPRIVPPPEGLVAIGRAVWERVERDRILAVAAGVTFYALLAVFPAVGAFVSLYGLVADPAAIAKQLDAVSSFLPGGAIDILGSQIQRITSGNDHALGFAFFLGLATSLWSANAGMKAVFDALNVAYGETEKRSFLVLNATALSFTIGAILLVALAVGSVVVVPVVLGFVGLGGATDWLVRILRWPLLLAVVAAGLTVLYRWGPSRKEARLRWVAPGNVVAAIGWLVFSMLFSWYVGSFGSYNETYGSLGAAIGFMTWMWLSTVIILVGAELNIATAREVIDGARLERL